MTNEELLRIIEKAQFDKIASLSLEGEHLTSLPSEIGRLAKLERLGLKNNQLTSLPPEIGRLTNLKELYLGSNQLTLLPTEIGELENLKWLHLINNQLTSLPPEIGKLANLKGLSLGGNQLVSLPPEIGKLANLEELDLHDNQLTSLPPEMGKLTNLKWLYLRRNKLASLPLEIGKLTNMKWLSLSNNQLTSFPPEIGRLANLKSLYLENNKLASLPPEIGKLANLKYLYLYGNKLISLPLEIGKLANLKALYLRNNQLTSLPLEIGRLANLTNLSLHGNPLTSPPPEVIRQGTKAVLAYLRNLEEKAVEKYEAKLIILGDGGEGKTCLSRALRELEFKKQNTTHGVEIDPWIFAHPDKQHTDITLNIWDFEGQEINHQSHQFFLTKRSLYVLVFKGREQFRMDRAEYWLDTIRSRAPECEVLLVATECEERTPYVPLDRLREKYPDLLKTEPFFLAVGCANFTNIPELREQIAKRAASLELMGLPWPQSYEDVENAIKERAEEKMHITRGELYDIFSNSDIKEEESESLANVMGELGFITHFPDCAALKDFIVLRPQWLTKAISLVLENPKLAAGQGECKHDWLGKLWEQDYPGLFTKFHNCMKEFELCYQCEDDFNLSLVPLRFGFAPPKIPWRDIPDAKERRIEYRFDVTPPAGIFARFIVKTHHMIVKTGGNPKGVYWHNGVFLATGKDALLSEALCVFNREDRKLSITVKAAFPQNMIEQLNGFANAVFGFFEGLKVTRYYGCVKKKEDQCSSHHSEKRITFALTRENKTVDCEDGLHMVDAFQLVYGFSSFAESKELNEMVPVEVKQKPEWMESKGRDIYSVLQRLDLLLVIVFELLKNSRQLPAEIHQKLQLTQRDFLDAMSDARDFHTAPSIVSITPVDQSRWNPKKLFERKYRLIPYCEYEGGIHKCGCEVKFGKPKVWWQKTAPTLSFVLKVLTATLTAGFVALPMGVGIKEWEEMKYEVGFMKSLTAQMPKLEGGAESGISGKSLNTLDGLHESGLHLHDLSALGENDVNRIARMQLARLMKEIAPDNYEARQWGDLERVRMPDNKYRWLCKKHRDELKSKRG